MKKVVMQLMAMTAIALSGCTENKRAKEYGGEMMIEVPKDRKVVTATWKDSQLWYLTRPRKQGERAETWVLQEKSNFGWMEGKIQFVEKE